MVRNKNLYGLVATFAICLALVCSLYSPSGATAVDSTGNCTIAVSGSGTIEAEPNQAKVSLGVETQSENVTDAMENNTLKMMAIYQAMEELGFSKDNIETTYFSVSPVRDYETKEKEVVAYRVYNEVTVEISNLEEIGKVIEKATNAGANNVKPIEFGLTEEKEKELKNEAIKKACEDAESKADAIASSFGLVNLRVASVKEIGVSAYPYRAGGFDEAVPIPKSAAIAPPIVPKAVEVKANLEVVYECS